jgi:SPP1 gp7 family putative phage head morphogenesis protein
LNEARYAEFTDPELAGFVVGLRYAAVLDSSTTEVCTELDGAEFRVDSEVWDTYRPPNHFNCRSILVPITEVDGWDFEESDEPIVDPQDGFK